MHKIRAEAADTHDQIVVAVQMRARRFQRFAADRIDLQLEAASFQEYTQERKKIVYPRIRFHFV